MDTIMRTLAVAWKDLKVLLKDKGALAVLFLMPLLFAVIFGAPQMAASNLAEPGAEDVPQVKVYIVNEDPEQYGIQVVETLHGVKVLEIEEVETADRADALVADGEAPAAVIIPADFSQKIATNLPTTVRIIKDPTQQEAATLVVGVMNAVLDELGTMAEIQYGIRAVLDDSGILEAADPETLRALEAQNMGVIWTQVEEMRRAPLISVKSENLAGEELESEWNIFSFFMPAFATMFGFFLIGVMAKALLTEKEDGSFRRLLASPMHRGCIIAGKMLAYMLVVFVQVLIMFSAGKILFDMPLGNSPDGLLLITLGVALAATSLGMLIGALSRTSEQADTLGFVIGAVLMVAGGCIAVGGIWVRSEGFTYTLTQLTPHGHAVDGYLKLMAEGGSLVDVLPNVGILFAFAVAFFAIAMWRFKFE
jgi:ABC-2 type transport system permease protein